MKILKVQCIYHGQQHESTKLYTRYIEQSHVPTLKFHIQWMLYGIDRGGFI